MSYGTPLFLRSLPPFHHTQQSHVLRALLFEAYKFRSSPASLRSSLQSSRTRRRNSILASFDFVWDGKGKGLIFSPCNRRVARTSHPHWRGAVASKSFTVGQTEVSTIQWSVVLSGDVNATNEQQSPLPHVRGVLLGIAMMGEGAGEGAQIPSGDAWAPNCKFALSLSNQGNVEVR